MTSDKEPAHRLGEAARALQTARLGLWDARNRGDGLTLEFYRTSVEMWCDSIKQRVKSIRPKGENQP